MKNKDLNYWIKVNHTTAIITLVLSFIQIINISILLLISGQQFNYQKSFNAVFSLMLIGSIWSLVLSIFILFTIEKSKNTEFNLKCCYFIIIFSLILAVFDPIILIVTIPLIIWKVQFNKLRHLKK